MEYSIDLLDVLNHIDPSQLNYQEWCNVGMALKEEGYSPNAWDTWSAQDAARYHEGECYKKWDSFKGTGVPITGGTIVQYAREQGWTYSHDDSLGTSLDWDATIEKDEYTIIDPNWIEGKEVYEPKDWNPKEELIKYLETLFDSTENVGYVTESWEKDGKYMPTKGHCDRTAGDLIEKLNRCNDISDVLGDYNPEVGAWIRFNPLDGKGIKNENVTEFKYALVESDSMEIEKQNATIRELELPVACLVHSGKKSLHAIVRVDASDYNEYRKRVDYLYKVCNKNGLEIDQQNRNPSRLSRMPGIMRNGQKQHLIDVNIGKKNWEEWYEWIESVNDDLPDPESLDDYWDDMPELAPPLINGVLRQGHKMLIAGPSKAGKSFALIEMCIAIAEGQKWLGWPCTQGKIMYVNLELDRASCLHRFKDVYNAMGIKPDHLKNIDIWNLRGKAVPMDKLAPKLIRRAAKKDYIAIVIDPIYKVITGDENSADQMANFCNQFDKVCTELNCAVIYCHHHSKGAQGGKKSMDRASGSGVFARDPDALLDLIELDISESLLKSESNKAVCEVCRKWLGNAGKLDVFSLDDEFNETAMLQACRTHLKESYEEIIKEVTDIRETVKRRTAWRIDGTLREFPKFNHMDFWFDYPIHKVDHSGVLKDVQPEDLKPPYQKATEKKKSKNENNAIKRQEKILDALENCNYGNPPTVKMIHEYTEIPERTIREWVQNSEEYELKNRVVTRIDMAASTEN